MTQLDGDEEMGAQRRHAVSRRSNLGLAIAFLALVLAAGGVWYWRTHLVTDLPTIATAPQAPVAVPAAVPAPADDEAAPEPKVDPLALLRSLSTSPAWASWVAEPKLIQRLTAAANMVAAGESPRPVLGFLAPKGEFAAAQQDGKLLATPASRARYDAFTHVVTEIDAAKAGAAYSDIAGVFQRAFREIGRPGERFTPVLHKAIHVLRDAPVPATEPELVEKGAIYAYADPKLEALRPAQKQLLRLGTANARALQAWLAAFERALPER